MKQLATSILLALGLLITPVVAAQVTVSGTVTDAATNQPFPGVQVIVKGTPDGTVTDSEGMYSLSDVAVGSTLEFRFVGYRIQEVLVSEDTNEINVQLSESILEIDEFVVVGSRRLPRLVKDSAVPVDVFGPRDLASQTSSDIDEILRTQIPSYNVQRHGIDDEATLVRPITLRGLSPDNVVVLVNGKRRHRSASLALLGSSLNTGSQGADINMIPSIALKQVEVLRDGAAAQYGADAVAGVFNMQLRDNNQGVHVRLQGGMYAGGDDLVPNGINESNGLLRKHNYSASGRNFLAAANVGLPLTERGFLNLSLEYRDAAPTIRSGLRRDENILLERGYPVNDPAQIWGSPDISNSIVGFINAGIDVGANAHIYAFGGYGNRESEGGFYFRSPGTNSARAAVFRSGSVRAVADLNESDDIICSEVVPGLEADFSAVQSFIDQYKGQCFLFNELFPGGFTPRFGANIHDLSVTTGVRGGVNDGFSWDLSFSMGNSDIDYFIYNTVNASLGPDTPTYFKPRGYEQQEYTISASGSYPIGVSAFATPLNIAFGLEWHTEEFTTEGGDPDSWANGKYGTQGFSVGSNGYQGLNPKFAGSWNRPNIALYLDLETDITTRLTLGVASRYENYYDDFGATLTGKVAALYRAREGLRFRGTVSTGFRAPTPGQANLWALQTALSGEGDQLVETGQLPPTHPISAALGGQELTEETAFSFTLGTIVDLSSNLTLTLDYFDISLQDRISLTGNIAITEEIRAIIAQEGGLGGGETTLREIKFFSNDFDTRTRGIDLLLAYDRESNSGNATQASLAWNWTRTSLEDFSQPQNISTFLGQSLSTPFMLSLLTPRRQLETEDLNPQHRVVLMGRHIRGAVSGMVRLNYYDGWFACRNNSNECTNSTGSLLDEFDSAVIVDAEVGYRFLGDYRVSLGVDNVFDTYPDAHPDETGSQGNIRPESTPWDYNGRAYVLRLVADLF